MYTSSSMSMQCTHLNPCSEWNAHDKNKTGIQHLCLGWSSRDNAAGSCYESSTPNLPSQHYDSASLFRLLAVWSPVGWQIIDARFSINQNLDYDDVLGCRVDISGTNCDQCVSMVHCCFTSTKTTRFIRTGSPGHLDSHTAPELWRQNLVLL